VAGINNNALLRSIGESNQLSLTHLGVIGRIWLTTCRSKCRQQV